MFQLFYIVLHLFIVYLLRDRLLSFLPLFEQVLCFLLSYF